MFFPRLAERVKFLKEDEKGEAIITNYFEKMQAKAVEKALRKKEKNVALELIRLGKLTLEEIAECSGLTLKKVQALSAAL